MAENTPTGEVWEACGHVVIGLYPLRVELPALSKIAWNTGGSSAGHVSTKKNHKQNMDLNLGSKRYNMVLWPFPYVKQTWLSSWWSSQSPRLCTGQFMWELDGILGAMVTRRAEGVGKEVSQSRLCCLGLINSLLKASRSSPSCFSS